MEEELDKKLITSQEDVYISDDEKTRRIVEKYGSKDQDPFTSANCLSRFFLYWAYKIIKLGNLLPLKDKYFGKLKGKNSCVTYFKNIKNIWETKGYKLKKYNPLIQTGIRANIKYIIIVFIFSLIKTLINLVSIELFREYMKRFGMTREELENDKNYYSFFTHTQIGIICLIIKFIEIFFDRLCNEYKSFIEFKCTSEFECLLYDKLIKISPFSLKERVESEEIIDFINIDAPRITLLIKSFPDALTIPMNIIGYSYELFKFFGYSFIFGIIILILFMLINILFSLKFYKLYINQMTLRDKRMRIIKETFYNIKILKLYAWEYEYKKKIQEAREKELKIIEQTFNKQNLNSTIQWFAPVATTVVTIGVYQRYHEKLKMEDIMTALKIFNSIQYPIRLIPDLILNFNEVSICIKRFEKYLLQDEINPGNVIKNDKYMTNNNLSVKIENGNYSYGILPTSTGFKNKDLKDNNISKKENPKNDSNIPSIQLNIQSDKENQYLSIKNDSKNFTQNKELDNKLDVSDSDILKENEKEKVKGKTEKYLSKSIKPVLKNINCEIKKGEFICVIGEKGSGKSSFLNAILNNMLTLKGSTKLYVNGSIAYVSQKPWIQNGTIKDNIIFYKEYDEEKYKDIIDLTQLDNDLQMFDKGDLTEIGEKGVTLTGSQKARISIARALYAEKDIYIFDNPICALDENIGMKIMKNCIIKHLSNKTKILVTHALQYIPFANRIFYINKGEIKWIGTYQEIKKQSFFSFFYENERIQHLLERKTSQQIRDDFLRKITFKIDKKHNIIEFGKKTIVKEEKGELELSIYKDFLLKIVGICSLLIIIILMIIIDLSHLAQDLWLGYSIKYQEKSKNFIYFIVFILFGVVGCVFTFFKLKVQMNCNIHTSRTIHNDMVESLIRAPIPTFHDIIPKVKILNKFNGDINSVDEGVMNNVVKVLSEGISFITCIGICAYYEPYSLLTIPPILLVGLKISKFYLITSRKLRKIENGKKTPTLNFCNETITGISIIRAFGLQQNYLSLFLEKVDEHLKYRIIKKGCIQWYDMILDLISFCFVSFLIIFTILFKNQFSVFAVAIIYNYCDKMKSSLISGLHALISFENSMRGYENCVEYTKCPRESPAKKNIDNSLSNWPEKGKIEFINYSAKYRPDTEIVLKNLNFSIQGKEKIGIVGKTGSGKTTIALCLFRILEADQGKILIDNVDISRIGLNKLRNSLRIIPQEPDLMEGTLRDNIDPFNFSTDEDIMNVLRKIGLDYIVKRDNKGLQQEIEEEGNHLSITEKQLICIVRAILAKSKIIVIDEATSSNVEEERIFQRVINELLNDCTIITIAHRIKTILNYDKILILEKGKIVGFDSPNNLLNDKKSHFYELYSKAIL